MESERERIARELRERAEKQGDPSGWFEVIAMAIETDWSVINDPENFKNEPCRFAVMQERDALQARCDMLEAAAREVCKKADPHNRNTSRVYTDKLNALRSVVDGGRVMEPLALILGMSIIALIIIAVAIGLAGD